MRLSEEDTKTEYINPVLRKKGWHEGINVKMEYPDKPITYTAGRIDSFTGKRELNSKRGRQLDYLLYRNHDINHKLAVIEAKKVSRSVSYGIEQGIHYAQDLHIPFVFASNGKAFDFHDRLISKEKIIPMDDLPTEQQLINRFIKEDHLGSDGKQLLQSPYYHRSDGNQSRYYQINAVNKTLEAILHGKHHIMFTLATGTGKTYIASQIVYRLLNAKGLKHPIHKVLYLVDRNILADQPLDVNGDFHRWFHNGAKKLKSKDWYHPEYLTAYTIYFGLYQQLFGHGDNNSYKHFPRGFFNLIIVDEAHRGSDRLDSNWHKILNYFAPKGSNTIVVGMTATPKETKNANYGYFDKPVYHYSLKQGINDGFLAPYKVIQVEPNIDVKGFTPSPNEKDINGHVLKHRKYGTRDYDRTLVILNRDVLVARFVSNYLKKHQMRMAKTIFFCNNIPHAERMRRYLVDENSDLVHKYGNYVARLTSQADPHEVKANLEQFEDPDTPTPTLVTTSDMLRTGVNAKDIELIVLDTHVKSMTEFKQMIGRGTRLDTKRGKTSFVIMDFRNNTEKWSDPRFDGNPDQLIKINNKKELHKITKPFQHHNHKFNQQTHFNNDSDNSKYVPTLNNINVKVHDTRSFHFDKNGKQITDNIVLHTKRNLIGEFQNLKHF